MMISALAIGARVLNDANYLQAAQRAAAFILNKMRRPDGRLLARYRDGQALYPAYALTTLVWCGLCWRSIRAVLIAVIWKLPRN